MKEFTRASVKIAMLHGFKSTPDTRQLLAVMGKSIAAKTEALDFKEPARDGRPWFSGAEGCIVVARALAKSNVRSGIQNRAVASMVLERIGES